MRGETAKSRLRVGVFSQVLFLSSWNNQTKCEMETLLFVQSFSFSLIKLFNKVRTQQQKTKDNYYYPTNKAITSLWRSVKRK